MKAEQLLKRRVTLTPESFVEMVIWQVPEPVAGSQHNYKYRLAFIHENTCRVRYDNEAGKGDHKHIDHDELTYTFKNVDQLITDFLNDVRRWQDEHSNP